MLLMVLIWAALGYFDRVRHVPIAVTAVYWYFVAAIWIGVFFTLTCTPYFY
jgi:heme/copper-type cytochrome/quinol oxidase subunit 3